MINITNAALTAVATSITIMITITMLFYEGYADLNVYGEGGIEAILTGLVALAGWKQLVT